MLGPLGMRCFYHQDREAIGTCKSCGKGLCPDCAVDLGKGLACRDRCEQDVRAVIALVERNIQLQPTTTRLIQAGGSARWAGSIFFLASGAVFLYFGLTSDHEMPLVSVLGGCFVAFGLFQMLWALRIGRESGRSKRQ
jgi:hypothetical protein